MPPASQQIDQGGTVTLSATFEDLGLLDTHTATIDWGDGTSVTINDSSTFVNAQGQTVPDLTEPTASSPGTITIAHLYDDSSAYSQDQPIPLQATLTVADDHGGTVSDAFQVTVLDLTAPSSSVASLPQYTTTPDFTVSWSGTDNAGGSGIASYDVYASVNGGAYTLWQANTTATSATYPGQPNSSYAFYSVATDEAGNMQATPAAAQSSTTVVLSPPTSSVAALPATTINTTFPVSWSGSGSPGLAHFDVYVSDNGGPFAPFVTDTTATSAEFTGQVGHTYGFYSLATDTLGHTQTTPAGAQASTAVVAPVAITANDPSVPLGQPISFQVTVTGGAGQVTPTGEVTLEADGLVLSDTGLSDGVANFADISSLELGVGTTTVTVLYAGDGVYPAASASTIQIVTEAVTKTTLASSDSTVAYGSSIVFTATVSTGIAGLNATGSVTFFDDGVSFGTSAVVDGVATVWVGCLTAGGHSITAAFNDPSGTFQGSTAAAVTQLVTFPGTPADGDVSLYVPTDFLAQPGSTVTIPVDLMVTDPNALAAGLGGFTVPIAYDPTILSNPTVTLGSYLSTPLNVTADSAPFVLTADTSTAGEVILSAASNLGTLPIPADTLVEIGEITFTVSSGAPKNPTVLNVQQSSGSTELEVWDAKGDSVALAPSVTNLPTDAIDGVLWIGQETPLVVWPAPTAITYGTALGAAELDALASVAGTFTYTPALGTVLSPGNDQSLSVSFTPDDTTDYTTASMTVPLDVLQANTALGGLTASQAIWNGTASINLGGTITSNSDLTAPGDVSVTVDGITQTAAIEPGGSFSTTFNTQAIPASAAPYTITYTYAGNTDFTAVSDESTSLTVIAAAITPVSPNPTNTPVSSVTVTLADSITTTALTAADLSLTDDGGPNLVNGVISLYSTSSDTYVITSLSGLNPSDGLYTLTLNGAGLTDQAGTPISGTLSTSWLLDTTPPTSTVSSLPEQTTSTSFTVPVTSNDPTGPNGSTPSGVASIAIYDSEDSGPYTLFATVTPANPSALFTGQAGHIYGFYSIATDNAGNVQATPPGAEQTIAILQPLSVTSISAVVPDPRNLDVSSLNVDLSLAVAPGGFDWQALTLTDNGGPNLITSAVGSKELAMGNTYVITELSGLTQAEGEYTLTVNAADITDQYGNPGSGTMSVMWLMDTTTPTSTVNSLPAQTASTSFNVSVTSSDPTGSNGSTPSGVASIAIYDSEDGGAYSLFTTVTPASSSALFTGQAGHSYGFYSVATDNAGNVQATPTAAQQTVQILSNVFVTSIAAVSPNPRNTPVSTVAVTFSTPVNPSTFSASTLTLTDNGNAVAITSAVSLSLVSGNTYDIDGLAGFTTAEGAYNLTVNASAINDTYGNAGTGSLSTSWLMDITPPTSTVSSLPAETTSTSFNVAVTSNDPTGSNGSTPSGVASIAIYDSEDGGAYTRFATVTQASPAALFTGQAGHTYGFYSIATDSAGNVQATPATAQETVQILQPVFVTSIAAVTPNPRNRPVSTVAVTFSIPVNPSTFSASALTLTDNSNPVAITSPVSLSLVSGNTYDIDGLAGFTTAEGAYNLTVNASGIEDTYGNAGTGSLSTSWLMDTTPPTSTVSSLPAETTSTNFNVSVTSNDPTGSNASTPSGVASIAIYDSDDGGVYTRFATVTQASSAALFTGQAGHTYGFYSVATDGAGNRQATPATAQETVQILQPVAVTSIAAVSPNTRNTPVSTVAVTFSIPVNPSTFSASTLTLTDNGNAVAITSAVSLSLVSGNAYDINGLVGLTTAEGNYSLTVNASAIDDTYGNAGTGSMSTSWLMDTTPPTSTVTSLPPETTSTSFNVSVTSSDPTGSNESTPSGVASISIFDSEDGGAYTRFATVTQASSAAFFTGQAGHTYGFYSIATDNAGNVQATPVTAQETVQILQPVAVTSIAAVSPNMRNTPVSTVAVTFSIPVNPSTFSASTLTLTDNGNAVAITSAVSLSLVSGSTYDINGLAGLTTAEGTYNLTVNASGIEDTYGNLGTGSVSTSWLMDTTPPTSMVNSLPAETTSTSFNVSVTSNDPTGSNASTPSGVASIAIYDSEDGRAYTRFATVTQASSAALFTGQAGHTYAFYSIATDNAGNVQATPVTAQETVQILQPVAATSIAAVSPNTRNTPVSTVAVTFSIPVNPSTFSASTLTLTDNGNAVAITSAVSLSLVSGSTYDINGLAGLTAAEGSYRLTVNASAIDDTYGNAGTGSLSNSWLMDTTSPTSTVNSLPPETTSTSFNVSVTSNDPTGSNASTPSGVASIAIYDSEDGGSYSLFTTVTPASPSALFTGQAGHTYGFFSIATDNAGNVQPTPTAAEQTVQIISPLSITSIASVSPNPRNTAVSSIDVTFSEPIKLSTFTDSSVTLTDNSGGNLITSVVTFASVSGSTYQINGLSSLTANNGNYTLSVNAAGIDDQNGNPGSGSLSTSWLMDTTPPTSTVNLLPKQGTSLTFAVTVTGSDDGSPASGVKSYNIYSSTNAGAWSLWTTVPASNPTANFTGQSSTTYAFYSTATDNAGNTQAYNPLIEASTYLPDLIPPVTVVDGTTGTNPSTVCTATGTFTLNLTGTDPGGGVLTYFEVFASVDSGPYEIVGPAIPAGPANSAGIVQATIPYQGITDGAQHTYAFYSIGLDSGGHPQAAPATANLTLTETFATPTQLQTTALIVEDGAVERSFIRYLQVDFNESDSQSGGELTQIVNSLKTASPEIQLYQYDLNDDASSKTAVSLSGVTALVIDHAIELDFGANGLGGSPTTTAADGYYEIDIKLPSGTTDVHNFYRLLGDVTGDGTVDENDLNEIAAEINLSNAAGFAPLGADVTGEGTITALDLTLATRAKGHKLKSDLSLG